MGASQRLIPVIVTQAVALAFPDTLRNCVWWEV